MNKTANQRQTLWRLFGFLKPWRSLYFASLLGLALVVVIGYRMMIGLKPRATRPTLDGSVRSDHRMVAARHQDRVAVFQEQVLPLAGRGYEYLTGRFYFFGPFDPLQNQTGFIRPQYRLIVGA